MLTSNEMDRASKIPDNSMHLWWPVLLIGSMLTVDRHRSCLDWPSPRAIMALALDP